jgi:hypothetical protein
VLPTKTITIAKTEGQKEEDQRITLLDNAFDYLIFVSRI